MKAVLISDLQTNQYRELLISHLHTEGCDVENYLPEIFFIKKFIRKDKVDVLHLHVLHPFFFSHRTIGRWIKFFVFTIQILALKIVGIRIVWTAHEWSDRFTDGKHDFLNAWKPILGRLFSAVITHCNATKRRVESSFSIDQSKVYFIPHGNHIGAYRNDISQAKAREVLGVSKHQFAFLMFGNIHRTKGFIEGLEAFKKLRNPECYLLIAGNPAEADIVSHIQEETKDRDDVLFMPQLISDDEVQLYFNACDCVVLPYKIFTTSGVAILAMSFGKPCIAPDLDFFHDMLDSSGAFLYDATLENGLPDAMKQAVSEKHRIIDMGKHNLLLANQLNWERAAQKTIEVYKGSLLSLSLKNSIEG